mgnify:CR=1 FL=1
MILNIFFIIALTFPVAVASTTFGINYEQFAINNSQFEKKWFYAFVVALGQGVMYSLGSLLGGTFMHMMESFSKLVVFALCFSISYRMLLDTLKIKNGSNLIMIEKNLHLILLSVALGVNAFIAGLMADFMPLFQDRTPYIIMAAAFVWAVVSIIIPFTKVKLTLNSFLNVIFAAVIVVIGLLELV